MLRSLTSSRQLVVALVVTVVASTARGNEVPFAGSDPVTDGTGTFPHFTLADLDGDGDLDLLWGSESTRTVEWNENLDGRGCFGPDQLIGEDIRNFDVAAGDVDGDDDLDIVAADFLNPDSDLVWFENTDGQGTFGPPNVFPTTTRIISFVLADLDGDTDLDVLSVATQGDTVCWFENTDGLGTFGPEQLIANLDFAQSVDAVDIDGDTDLDVVAVGNTGEVLWYENTDGMAAFGPGQIVISSLGASVRLATADIDGDSDADVVVMDGDEGVHWVENDGTGTFVEEHLITEAVFVGNIQNVGVADLDCDGDLDVISKDNTRVLWHENVDGAGSFVPDRIVHDGAAGSVGEHAAADMDGDGDVDVVAWLATPGIVHIRNLVKDRPLGRNPGSLLVYPVQRSGPTFFTMICLTNTNREPQTPQSFGGGVLAHYEYVNVTPDPSDPFMPTGCTVFDRVEYLTPADTLCVVTACHNAVAPGGQEGYLVVSAQDPAAFDTPFCHDDLVGSELVINAAGGMYALNAIPFQCLCDRDDTDVDGDGRLDLDGLEYTAGPEHLILDSFLGVAGSQLALLNLTGPPLAVNTVSFTVWNDNEFALSATRPFRCWFDQPLEEVSPLFSEGFLSQVPNDPNEFDIGCDGVGDFETGWALIDSISVRSGNDVVSDDGLLLGAITAGPTSVVDGGRLLWESRRLQTNGSLP